MIRRRFSNHKVVSLTLVQTFDFRRWMIRSGCHPLLLEQAQFMHPFVDQLVPAMCLNLTAVRLRLPTAAFDQNCSVTWTNRKVRVRFTETPYAYGVPDRRS